MQKVLFVCAIIFLLPVNLFAQVEQYSVTVDYFQRFVIDGGPIAWFILIPLSIITVALIIDNLRIVRNVGVQTGEMLDLVKGSINRRDISGFLAVVNSSDVSESFIPAVMKSAIPELKVGIESAEYAAVETIDQHLAKLFRRIEYLNIIGNVSPMIGLFGTVYGIILAFNKLVEVVRAGGVTQPDQLAEGISIALVTTFWGLIIAIPALAVYGVLRNKIDAFGAELANNVIEIIHKIPDEFKEEVQL